MDFEIVKHALTAICIYTFTVHHDLVLSEFMNLYYRGLGKLYNGSMFVLTNTIVGFYYTKNFVQNFIQHFMHPPTEIHPVEGKKNLHKIDYFFRDRPYTIFIHTPRKPHKVLMAESNGSDVTEILKQFAGPGEDFHGRKFTPSDLGLDEISIYFSDGTNILFKKDEVITI